MLKPAQQITAEDRAEQLKPLDNKLILLFGLLVTLMGVCGVLGNIFNYNFLMSFTPPSDPATMALPTAIALIFLGVGIKTILDTQPYEKMPQWLWPVRYTSIIVPFSIGLWHFVRYLIVPRFDWLDLGTHGLLIMAFETSFLLILAAVALFIFLTRHHNEQAVVYGVSLPAFMIFNIGILGLVGHLYNIPFLYAFKIALPTALSAVLTGLIFMIGTIPYKGIWLPLLSPYPKARVMAALSGLFGLSVLYFGVNSIAISLGLNGVEYGNSIHPAIRHVVTGAVYVCNIVAILIMLIGLRASRYYSQALQYAQQVQAAEAPLRRIVESNMLGIFYWEQTSGRITYANEAFLNMLGFSQADLQADRLNWQKLTPIEYTEIDAACAEQIMSLERGMCDPYEKQLFAKDGRRVDVLAGGAKLSNTAEQGVAYIIDISPRKQMEESLKRSLKDLTDVKYALDQSDIVAFTDRQGTITYVNDAFCQISRFNRNELIGQNHRIINSGYHSSEFFREMWATIGRGQVWKGEIKNRAKDGTYYWVDTTIVPFMGDDGKPYQYVAIRHDITARKDSEQSLAESNRDLEHFATIASHDLQAPLRKVKIFSEQLMGDLDGKLTPENKDTMQRILRSVGHMQQMVSDILALSKVSRMAQAFESVDLSKVLTRVLFNLDERIKQKNAHLEIGQLTTVFGDEIQMEQLLQNLIDNALKYQPEGQRPIIRIDINCQGDRYCDITVADNGIGLKNENIERIFNPFERLHGKSSPYEGTGVGLAICKRIVERHGGTIEVQSEPGQGSVFKVTLPMHHSGSKMLQLSQQ